MVGKYAEKPLVLRFGVPAIIAAFAGAAALGYVARFDAIVRYSVGPLSAAVTPVKLAMGLLIFVFALFELLPRLRQLKFDRRYLTVGGVLSGFFGGFSGHQGALRAAFLAKMGGSTEAFVGTNAVIGFMVDMARIATYAAMFLLAKTTSPIAPDQWPLVLTGIVAAFVGVMIGKRLLHKIAMQTIQTLTGLLLLVIAFSLTVGFV